jgi:hypothetical protein
MKILSILLEEFYLTIKSQSFRMPFSCCFSQYKETKNGEPLVKENNFTGFSNTEGEAPLKLTEVVPFFT